MLQCIGQDSAEATGTSSGRLCMAKTSNISLESIDLLPLFIAD